MSKNVQCFAIIVLIICVAVSAAAGAKKNVTEHCSVYIGKTRTELGIHFDDSKIWSFEEAGSCYKGQGRLSVWYCWRHEWNFHRQKSTDQEVDGFRQYFYMLDDIWQMDIQKISRTVDLFHVQGFENFEYHEVEYTIVDDFGRPTGEFETDTYYCWTNIVPSTGIRLFYVIHDDPSRDELTLSIFTEDLWRFRNQLFNEPERPWWDVRYDMFDTY